MPANNLETVYFHLDPVLHSPASPDLINRIRNELGQVRAVPLVANKFARRFNNGNLLAGIKLEDRDKNGVLVETVSSSLDRKAGDVWKVLSTATHPNTGLTGNISTVFTFLDGRDDNPKKNEGGVLQLEQDRDDISTHSHQKLSAVALWDIHSGETIKWLESINGEGEKPEIVSLTAMPLFVDKLNDDGLLENGETVVAAPDFGSFTKTREMAKALGKPMIFIDKERPKPHDLIIKGIYMVYEDGKIEQLDRSYLENKRVIFFDDMFDTGGTAIDVSKEVKKLGAAEVVFAATHAVFSEPDQAGFGEEPNLTLKQALEQKIIDYIYVSDSLPQYKDIKHEKVKYISLARAIAALIKIAADKASPNDFKLIRRCLYNPGPSKDTIGQYFIERNISPAYEGFSYYEGIFGNKEKVVFSRQGG